MPYSSMFKIVYPYPDTSNPFKYANSSNSDKWFRVETQYTTLDQ